ncbi:MAG: hypothetical protein LBQ81_09550 [Zoogloeaceae bacterium]|jgi:hypothetical protein|nr:hypothetical protein [Zoogloeaceae bacterium]
MNLRAGFRKLAEQWQGVSIAQRSQFVAGLCVIMAGFYGLVIWPLGHKQLEEILYKESKFKMRQKKSGQEVEYKPAAGELDLTRAQAELAKTQESLNTLKAEQARLTARFIALEDLDGAQNLKSELTRLAEASDMEIVVLEHIHSQRDRPPTPELLKAASQNNPYKRPLLLLKARANYHGLMRFLDGLQSLSYIAAPVWSSITAVSDGKKPANAANALSGQPARQLLDVEIRFAI